MEGNAGCCSTFYVNKIEFLVLIAATDCLKLPERLNFSRKTLVTLETYLQDVHVSVSQASADGICTSQLQL